MERIVIKDENGKGYYTGYQSEDWEYVNPVYKLGISKREMIYNELLDLFSLRGTEITPGIISEIKRYALNFWQKIFQEAANSNLPDELIQILNGVSKKEQLKLLNDFELNPDLFFAFIVQAWEKYRYRYSRYHIEYNPIDLQGKSYPKLIYKKTKDNIISIGKTDLSKNQIRLAIDERRVTVCHFFDKEDIWHCLFLTYKGIGGEELPHMGEPHMHFISNCWGIPRDIVLTQLKSYRYKLPSIRIVFNDYPTGGVPN
jgi:hypothetical protein